MIRGLLERLRHKYGPLPLWAWAAIVGGGIAVFMAMRRGPSEAQAPAVSEPAFAFGGEPDYGDTGMDPVEGVSPDAGGAGAVYDDRLESAIARAGDIAGKWEEVEDAMEAQGWSFEDGQVRAPAFVGGEEVIEPDRPADVVTPAKPAQTAQGVTWGGRVFTSKTALGRWIAERGGGRGNAGLAYKEWAAKHPTAAARLGGAAPKPPGKRPAKPPPKPSARAPGRQAPKKGTGQGGARSRAPQPKPAPQPARPRAKPKPAPKPAAKKPPKRRRRVLPFKVRR